MAALRSSAELNDSPGQLTRGELADAVPVSVEEIDAIEARGLIASDEAGNFRPSDIQRVRAVEAMRSPGIDLDQLLPVFEQQLFTFLPMDILFPEPARMTATTVAGLAESLEMDAQQMVRLIAAAGFPAYQVDEPMRGDDLELVRQLVELGRIFGSNEAMLRLARVIGQSARQAGEAGVALFDENVTSRIIGTHPDLATRTKFNTLAAQGMNRSAALLSRLYLRHIEHALLRLWAVTAENFLDEVGVRPADHAPPGLVFVDLTGFTTLTEDAGDDIAARLAATLAEVAEQAATRHSGRVVKLLGDGAMLHFEQPLDAVRAALDLIASIAESGLPAAHAGVHSGPMIRRDGDYFGRTVNLAARISGQAAPGQVLVSPDVSSLPASDLVFRLVGDREMKGIGSLTLYEADWGGERP